MTRDYDAAFRKYQEVRAKQFEAQSSQNLETERKGERFTLIEPPMPSEAPISPQRGLILTLGMVLSLLLGVGIGFLVNLLDGRVRGPADLAKLLEVPPLAQLPAMVTARDAVRARRQLQWSFGGATLALVTAAVLLHVLWRPLDLLAMLVLRRFGF